MAALTTASQVMEDAALTPLLFNLPDEASLQALIKRKINVADAWLQRRAAGVYNSTDPNIQTLLAQAEVYLALHYLTPILRAQKTYGTHGPYMSEEAAAYDTLVETNWRQEAISLLDEFLTLENVPGRGFARPQFITNAGYSLADLEPEESQLEDELEFARGIAEVPFATVTR